MSDKADVFLAQLRAQAASLLARYEQLRSFQHNLVRGVARETPIRQFLAHHLPARIGVGTGTIVSSDETPNAQHDVVLFDRDFCGPILYDETASAFPIETIHGIVEVKSGPDLQLEGLAASLSKIRSLRRLPGVRGNEKGTTPHGMHMIVSYCGPTAESAIAQLERANVPAKTTVAERLPIDMVLVLSERDSKSIETGYLLGYVDTSLGSDVRRTQYYPVRGLTPSLLHVGPDAFARWITHLINHLNGCSCFPPPLFAYFGFEYRIVNSEGQSTEADENVSRTNSPSA